MKFFVAFAALVAVAVATPLYNKPYGNDLTMLESIVAAIQSPSTDPATASLLEQQLISIIGASSPISVGPAIVDVSPISVGPALVETSPISVGPAFVDFPMPDGGVVTADEPVAIVAPSPVVQPIQPSPVVIGEIPAGATPLVQIIVNVNQEDASAVVVPTPVQTPVIVPGPVNIVDNVIPEAVVSPVQVAEPIVPGPVNVVDNVVAPVVPAPVVIGTPALPEVVIPQPVIVGTPIIPTPVVVLPEELN